MWICVFVCLLPPLFWYVLMACSLYSLPEVSECLSSWMLSSLQLSDLKILRPLSVSLCDWSWLCACSLIKLCRSKAHPTHTHKLCPLCYPPYSSLLSPPPLSPPFQQGNSMLCNFCQMSNTSLPSSAVPFVFNSHRLDWNTEPTATTTLDILLSTTKHEPKRSSSRGCSSPKTERNAKANAFLTLCDAMLVLLLLATVHSLSARLWHGLWLWFWWVCCYFLSKV